MGRRKPLFDGLLDEIRRRQLDAGPVVENPFWAQPEPHPTPERGCTRRGLCCRASPGWFAPGEAEAAADVLDVDPDHLARNYLVIDGCEVPGEGWVEVFAPLKLAADGTPLVPALTRVDDVYRRLHGACVFFDGSGCRIYAARPAECRAYVCTNPPARNLTHVEIARRWKNR